MKPWLLAAAVAAVAPAGADTDGPAKVILSSPITHSDWMVRDPAPAWGAEGVRQILDRCKECGWKRVYWRCFDGGRALYASRLLEPLHRIDEENYLRDHSLAALQQKLEQYDWGTFDSFAEAVAYGKRIGLEVHAWLSINEDDHGYGWTSRYTREHPETRWVRRDGRPYRSQQSFAFPEVRAYKLALLREILAYKPAGILFDWIRTGDVRDNPQTEPDGVANHGYERPNVNAFRSKCGVDPHDVPNNDPRWVQVRAQPQTVFMREARKLIRRAGRPMVVSALVQHPWSYRGGPTDTPYKSNLEGLLVDTRTWARERLVDEVVAAGYYREGGTPEGAYRWLKEEIEGKVRVWLYGWIANPDQFRGDTQLAERLGAPQFLLWESDYIQLPPANAELVKAMADYSATVSRSIQKAR